MKKLLFMLAIPIVSWTVGITVADAQTKVLDCNPASTLCESDPGVGILDECCNCHPDEVLVDTDLNGFVDSCLSEKVTTPKEACHGGHEAMDAGFCDGVANVCCRVPDLRNTGDRVVEDPCRGNEMYMDSCPLDGVPDVCCQFRRSKVAIPK
jgi:hypothetical protein